MTFKIDKTRDGVFIRFVAGDQLISNHFLTARELDALWRTIGQFKCRGLQETQQHEKGKK